MPYFSSLDVNLVFIAPLCHGFVVDLCADPRHDEHAETFNLRGSKRYALLDSPPLVHASAAAGCRSMLGGEYRMASPGCLPPVIAGVCRRQTLDEELARMLVDGSWPLFERIVEVGTA